MKSLLYVLTALVVVGLAFWAYRENYATQQVLKETRQLQRQIGEAKVRLNMLNAEWAYLNRPDRLRELAVLNYDRLGLLPMRPAQFGRVDEIAFPPPPATGLPIANAVDVSNMKTEPNP